MKSNLEEYVYQSSANKTTWKWIMLVFTMEFSKYELVLMCSLPILCSGRALECIFERSKTEVLKTASLRLLERRVHSRGVKTELGTEDV